MSHTFVPHGNEPIRSRASTDAPTPTHPTAKPAEPAEPTDIIRPEDVFDDFGGTGRRRNGW